MTKRIWAGLLALGMALTALPFGIYAEETAWEEEANASEETLDGGLDESAEEFADGLPDYILEPETDVVDGAADDESADELSEQEESLTEEATPDLPDFIPEEEPPTLEESELPPVQAGDFVRVTPNTRVYLEIDETAGDADDGELYDGNFVNEANVYVEQARQDAQGRTWLLVRYLYGAEEPNGEMAWTDTATVWVLAEETRPSDAADYDVTDYAFPYPPAALYAASDFNLRDYNAGVQTFYPGQQNLYGSSGHDSEYKQIAKLDGYGTIYATPHYLEGQTVYCLEHTMNSPGTKNNASGPFEVVDLDGYALSNEIEFARKVREASELQQAQAAKETKARIRKAQKRCKELDVLIQKLYESYALEKISEKRFDDFLAAYEKEQAELKAVLETDTEELRAYEVDSDHIASFLKLAGKYREADELTTPMIYAFVEKIIVHAPEKIDGERHMQIDIYLKFIGNFQVPQDEPTAEEMAEEEKQKQRRAKNREKVARCMERKKLKDAQEKEDAAHENDSAV